MMSQTGYKLKFLYTYCSISWQVNNQTIKFGQFIEYNKGNILIQKSCRKSGRKYSSRPLFVFKKSFVLGKSKWSTA